MSGKDNVIKRQTPSGAFRILSSTNRVAAEAERRS